MITKTKKTLISLAIILTPLFALTGVFTTSQVNAGDTENAADATGTGSVDKCGGGTIFIPTWYDGLCDSKTGGIISPGDDSLGDDTSARFGKWVTIIAMNIVTILLYVVGYVSLGFTIYGGFKYMISGDTASGTSAARKTITNAVIGLILSIMAVAIVKLVTGAIV